jgi:Spy/CpxP family protein refolding chaperone
VKRFSILFGVLLSCASIVAWAGSGYHKGHGKGHGAMGQKLLKEAGLSDQQVRRVKLLHDEVEKQTIDMRHAAEKLHLEKKQLMQSYKVDKAKVMTLMDKLFAHKLEIMKAKLSFKLKVRAEMTEAQWTKLAELKADFHSKHKGGHGKGHGKGHDCGKFSH